MNITVLPDKKTVKIDKTYRKNPKGEQNFYLPGSSQRAISKWVEL